MVLGWLTFSKQQTASMSHPIIHLTLLHWNSVDDRHLSLSKLLDYLTVWKRLVNTKSSCVISWTKLTDKLHLTHQYAHYLTSQVGLLVIRLIIVCIVQIVTSLHDEDNRFSLARQTGTFCFFLCSFCFFHLGQFSNRHWLWKSGSHTSRSFSQSLFLLPCPDYDNAG